MLKVLAGIVLFNPDMDRLAENLEAVVNQVDEVICIDNGSSNICGIQELLGRFHARLIRNEGNLGIAKALNQILGYAVENGYEWFLTLDQDSVCYPGLIEAYEKYVAFDRVGMITSWAVDRNVKTEEHFGEGEEYDYVTYCITSGALVNAEVCMKCGGWDEILFIDNVDGDLCIHLKIKGYKVLRVQRHGFSHEVGHGKNVRFLWKKEIVSNHPALRQYYMARNRVYVARKYPGVFSLRKELAKELRNYRLILMYEDDKLNKIKARMKGVRDGLQISCNPVE